MMNFAFKSRNLVSKTMNLALKTMNFGFQMQGSATRWLRARRVVLALCQGPTWLLGLGVRPLYSNCLCLLAVCVGLFVDSLLCVDSVPSGYGGQRDLDM